MVKIHILCIELRVVSTLTTVLDTCWVAVSALQHGPVLNHPLIQSIKLDVEMGQSLSVFMSEEEACVGRHIINRVKLTSSGVAVCVG